MQPLSLRPLLGERAAPRRPARAARHTAPSQSMHDEVTRPNLGAADHHRHVELPHLAFRRPLRAHEPRPDRQADLSELVEIAHRAVDEDPRDARAPAPASPAARRRARSGRGLAARQHEHVTRARVRDGRVHHRVVARRAERDPRGPCDARARHDLCQRRSRRSRSGRRPREPSRPRAARDVA